MIAHPVANERSRGWRRWAWRTAAGAVVVVALFVFGWVPYVLGGLATTRRFEFPDRENGGLSPASFGLGFEDVSFRSRDGVGLVGWWVPAAQPWGTVVMAHGLNRTRVEMVKKVPFVHEHGWNALLFDMRHHGDSGGEATTFGVREKDDVEAAVGLARRLSAGPVVLWGVSLGGAAVVLAGAEDPLVAGVICDSSFRNLRDTVAHHIQLLRRWRWWLGAVPTWPVTDEVLFWMGRRGHFDPRAADVLGAARRLEGRPALFVANSEDQRMPKEIAFELAAAAGPAAEVLIVPGRSHGGAWRDGGAAYEAAAAAVLVSSERAGTVARAASRGGPEMRSLQ
jgi:pimeloyl-ACP methyl ester carboxylesterase